MRRVWTLALAMLLALGMMAPAALADAHEPEIISPAADEVVYENTLRLEAEVIEDVTPRWSVRKSSEAVDPECIAETDQAGHHVRGQTDPYEVAEGHFTAEIDITDWDAGQYCLSINQGDPGVGSEQRDVAFFYIVDDYVKAGGVVTMDNGIVRGNGTHAMEGWVADAGSAGLLGGIEVNYRGLRDTCTFKPTSLSLDGSIPGTGVRATIGTDVTGCDMDPSSATFFVGESDLWDRGGIVVRPSGSTNENDYLIDNTPGRTGGASWVPLTHGNAYIISR